MSYKNESVLTRDQTVWLQAWLNTARADNCTSTDAATRWADTCLKAFKERFDAPNGDKWNTPMGAPLTSST